MRTKAFINTKKENTEQGARCPLISLTNIKISITEKRHLSEIKNQRTQKAKVQQFSNQRKEFFLHEGVGNCMAFGNSDNSQECILFHENFVMLPCIYQGKSIKHYIISVHKQKSSLNDYTNHRKTSKEDPFYRKKKGSHLDI